MLYRIAFESFDLFVVKCPFHNFLLKECKGMLKMMQLISNFLHKKTCFPLCNYMFIMSIWWKKKSHENF